MSPHEARKLAALVTRAKAKVALTVFNDPVPSARLTEAVRILIDVIQELNESANRSQ